MLCAKKDHESKKKNLMSHILAAVVEESKSSPTVYGFFKSEFIRTKINWLLSVINIFS